MPRDGTMNFDILLVKTERMLKGPTGRIRKTGHSQSFSL